MSACQHVSIKYIKNWSLCFRFVVRECLHGLDFFFPPEKVTVDPSCCVPAGYWFGIELDQPTGKHDGSVFGVRYFSCLPKYGVFAPPSRVQRWDATTPGKKVFYLLIVGFVSLNQDNIGPVFSPLNLLRHQITVFMVVLSESEVLKTDHRTTNPWWRKFIKSPVSLFHCLLFNVISRIEYI